MSTYRLAPGVAARVAAAIAPQVHGIAEDLGNETRRNAPPSKTWVTAGDEKVRESHREVNGSEIPANLRYQLPKLQYVKGTGKSVTTDGYDLAREPGDPHLPINQRINCRCASVTTPGRIAQHVQVGDPRVDGRAVTCRVSVAFPRVAESEYPDSEDSDGGWLRSAAQDVAAARRAHR